jgi:hypothetical protein
MGRAPEGGLTVAAELTIPQRGGGGAPLSQAPDDVICKWLGIKSKELRDDPQGQYAASSKRWVAGARAEMTKRGMPAAELEAVCSAEPAPRAGASNGAARPAPTTTAQRPAAGPTQGTTNTSLARPAGNGSLQGTFHDPVSATASLQAATQEAHLVAPAPICGALPIGCGIAISAVYVDPATETYGIPSEHSPNRGLGKVALDKISAAAGISWDSRESGRLDDHSEPHYVHYKAVGRVKDFDGTVRVISGEVEIDLRDGVEHGCSEKELPIARKFILRNGESKAKNRAIRSLGVRTKYHRDELSKPFVVAKVQFTGHTDDPELRRMFAEKTADAFLGGTTALYGSPSAPPRQPTSHQLPPAAYQAPAFAGGYAPPYAGQFAGHAPPAPGSVIDHEEIPPARPTPKPKTQEQAEGDGDHDDEHDPGFAEDLAT